MKLVEDGLKVDSGHSSAMWRLMQHQTYGFMTRKRYEKALKGFNYLISGNPLANFFLDRARCYMRLKMYLDATTDLIEAEMILPPGACETGKIKKMKKEISRVYVPKSHYEVLGVMRRSSYLQILLAYKHLKLAYKIDIAMSPIGHGKRKLEIMFKHVENAYLVLSDKDSRAEYNREMDKREISWPLVAILVFLLSVLLFMLVSSIQDDASRLNDAMGMMGNVETKMDDKMTVIEEAVASFTK